MLVRSVTLARFSVCIAIAMAAFAAGSLSWSPMTVASGSPPSSVIVARPSPATPVASNTGAQTVHSGA